MATELGQAYVQIMPSARGIGGAIRRELDPESDVAGRSAGGKIVSALKGVIAAAAIGKFIGSALTEGGELQQSLGGIETLFKENADKVKQYANEAYQTSGLSANDYMTNVTSFSASLLQSLGGDTEAAADKANTALIDMSDNANKMGTDMESIQTAYQGFAKQNYTMLDNLKLGYGGTKTEMQRLLADASKLSGVKYDINNLADVYDAIHVIQTELDITGTTAKESAETFSGSLASMKSAFSNVLGNLTLGTDLTPHLQALAQTASTFLFGNFLPMVGNILKSLPGAVVTFIQEAAPYFIEAGGNLVSQLGDGITTGLPILWTTVQEMLTGAMSYITENLPMFLNKGNEILINIANGILQSIPKIIESAGSIISNFVSFVMANLPVILKSGKDLLLSLADGIIENLPAIANSAIAAVGKFVGIIMENYPAYLKAGWEIISGLVTGIIERLPKIIDMGKDIVKGIWEGIKSMGSWLAGKANDFVDVFVDDVKGFLGIHSPSKVFQDEVGKNIVLGIGAGVEGNEKTVIKTVGEMAGHILSEAENKLGGFSFGTIDTNSIMSDEEVMNLQTTAATVVDMLKTGITANMFKISDIALETSQSYISAIREKISDFETAGRMMTIGLWKGIESGKSGLINNIVKMLEDAVRAAKDAMDINSPSRVWAEIGGFMSQGLGVGFVSEMRNVSKQIDNSIPSGAIRVANRSMGMIGGTGNPLGTIINDGGVHLHVAKMINSNDRDIQDVARILEFQRRQSKAGKGDLT